MNNGSLKITLSQRHALPAEVVEVKVSGVAPGTEVVIYCEQELSGIRFHGEAAFRTSASGEVDLSKDAPVRGDYAGVDYWGLFWSSKPAAPGSGTSPLEEGEVRFSVGSVGSTHATTSFFRLEGAPDIKSEVIRESGIHGVLFTSPGAGPRACVITLGGSEGGLRTASARLWASQGYVALALAYFGAEGLPEHLREIPLEYFGRALEYLQSRKEVDPNRIGVIGGSRGGELALLLGATFPAIRAVVAKTPSHVCWDANDPTHPGSAPAWTWKGKALPYLVCAEDRFERRAEPDGKTVCLSVPAFLKALEQSGPDVEIPLERIQGPVLLTAGEDDQIWPAALFVRKAQERLKQSAHPYENEFHVYSAAGHMFCFPGDPAPERYFFHPKTQEWIDLGGAPVANAWAGMDSLNKTRAFLERHLGRQQNR